jgi:hypothetical protein
MWYIHSHFFVDCLCIASELNATALSMQSIHSRVDVRFIDFAHTAPTPDEEAGLLDCGVLMGLQNLIHLLLKVYHGHARNHTRAFPLVSSLHLQPDESNAAGGAATGSASDLGTPSLSSTMLPTIIVGTQRCLRRPQSLTGAYGGSASGGDAAVDAAAMTLADSSNSSMTNDPRAHAAVIEMPVWGDEPVDVMEMTVTPRGHVLAQRLRRASDYLNAHVRQLPRVLVEQPAF